MSVSNFFDTDARIEYNGVQIDDVISSSVKGTPVYNNQGTAVKAITYQFEFKLVVSPDANELSTSTAMETLREKLLASGKKFVYEMKGFGDDFTIEYNPGQGVRQSIDYGPKPLLLAFQTRGGGGKSAYVEWNVEVTIPECGVNGVFKGLSEFWTTSSLKFDKKGYQTLTRTGYIEVMSGNDTNKIGRHLSESFRPYIDTLTDVNSMQGYHLEHDFSFTPDDRGCNFTLTYTEISSPNAYPKGVVEIKARHKLGSKLTGSDPYQSGFKTWLNTLDMDITLRPGVDKAQAWAIFLAVAVPRINQNQDKDFDFNEQGQLVVTRVKVPIVLALELEEEIFDHEASFSVTWTSQTSDLEKLFSDTGLFQKVEGNSWNDWVADIRQVQNHYGSFPLESLGNTTLIVDPCNQALQNSIPDTTREQLPDVPSSAFQVNCPPPESSWLDYQNKFITESSASQVVHTRYITDPNQINRGNTLPTDTTTDELSVDPQYNAALGEADHIIQDYGNDLFFVRMRGYAIRLGRPTNPPVIKQYAGLTVKKVSNKSKVSNETRSAYAGCPMYVTKWDITYQILGVPTNNLTENESTGEPGGYQ